MNKKFFITTKTPLRVSLFGGGTDIRNFFNHNTGCVVTTAIDKFVYVTIKSHDKVFGEKYRLNYSATESTNNIDKIKNKIIKACLIKFDINFPIYISTISDLPSNSGLGSSSSFTVGLLKALYELKNRKVSNKELAIAASKIEIEVLRNPIGLQDQFIASFGGFKFFRFKKNYNVTSKTIKTIFLKKILKKSVLIWTSMTRDASKLLKIQNSKIKTNNKYLRKMSLIAANSEKLFNRNKLSKKKFLEFLEESWEIKKKLSNKVSNKTINDMYEKLKKKGALGSKICGAGGGGFLFVYYKNDRFLKKIKEHNFYSINSWPKGCEVIYSEK